MSRSEANVKRIVADLYQVTREMQDNIHNGEIKMNDIEGGYAVELEHYTVFIKHRVDGGVKCH